MMPRKTISNNEPVATEDAIIMTLASEFSDGVWTASVIIVVKKSLVAEELKNKLLIVLKCSLSYH